MHGLISEGGVENNTIPTTFLCIRMPNIPNIANTTGPKDSLDKKTGLVRDKNRILPEPPSDDKNRIFMVTTRRKQSS